MDAQFTKENFEKVVEALQAYVHAQSRMLDRWADGDEKVKGELWISLHKCELAAREALGSIKL